MYKLRTLKRIEELWSVSFALFSTLEIQNMFVI